ncbi:uncharacterized protein A4U43_C05F34970 [Asparagus officinalis]|uniref:SBP-type domain-containing protein n=1 Tax=Asparagus officinalis TaxID=4686 RepID=A0A5P1F2A7_ASPOF|nr:squamosa promoter-binding-like protein 10 isoform X2 [Asparagus officinalis]ONK70560.1 uncharacterized protein A4U43_C05F34970 [Asparagus officinalis]
MMNRLHSSSSSASDPYYPFNGLDNNWDVTQSNYTHQGFDPPLPPIPMSTSFPFYSPQIGFVKREDAFGVGAGSRPIGLNLGHRTYFSSCDALAIDRLLMGRLHNQHQPRCQAEGCKADLSGAKHYHRRHKVCEFHSKATVVIAGGTQQRFCQQCSRFHVLAEFDESKRSCRKRLADHNRRRRKPQNNNNSSNNNNNSASSSTTTNSSDKTKHNAPRPLRDSNASKCTTASTTTGSGALEVNQGEQNEGSLYRKGPALSLGGAQQLLHNNYQHHFSPSTTSDSITSSFYHQSLFGPSPHEPSQPGGSGSDQHQTNLLHLGQAMFEVDFM